MQQQQQQGATQFGASSSGILPFTSAPLASRAHLLGIPPSDVEDPAPLAEVASPISSLPPPAAAAGNFDKLQVAGDFPDDETLAAAQGDDTERGGAGATGNRWPRQETLALLKIRSEMDASFRDATLKGPLWEEVSRKLAELGYKRSAKKCKEKFENVHKYYKRTKEGRAGRQDGKSYRFFTQLEALHSGSHLSGGPPPAAPSPAAFADASSGFSTAAMVGQPPPNRAQPISSVAPTPPINALPTRVVAPELQAHGISISAEPTMGFSFSSNSSSSASSDSDEETAGESQEGRKRKRETATTSRKMMAFFEGLMKQVMERQEAMQKRFLEAVEKREQDRMIREEAWRRQEMTRFNREQELLAQERAMAASRDTAIISYLQKITGQNISLPASIFSPAPATSAAPLASQSSTLPPPPPSQTTPPPTVPQPPPSAAAHTQPPQIQQPPHRHNQVADDIARYSSPPGTLEFAPSSEPPASSLDAMSPSSSSRWPKAEVHTLIKLRSGLDSKYQDSGPKGPLWEEISVGMQQLGYSRSAKRCKEKWENINKYYKKVKESNKKRPEDSKTCPYFHQLDALYRSKLGAGGGPMQRPQLGSESTNIIPSSNQQQSDATTMNRPQEQALAMPPPPPPPLQPTTETENKNGNSETNAAVQVQTGNGGLAAGGFFEQGLKKPEDIMKELMGQRRHQAATDHDYDKLDDDSDNMDQDDDDDDDEDNEDDEINNDKVLHYKI